MPSVTGIPLEETTGPQLGVFMASFDGELPQLTPPDYTTYRTMRKQPTIALARALSVAPVLTANWSIESDDDAPDGAEEFVKSELFAQRDELVSAAMYGGLDFGWAPFETVWQIKKGLYGLKKVKPLLHDITTIMVNKDTGAFAGFKQVISKEVALPLLQSLLINFRVEGTNWYGESLLENIRSTYDKWNTADAVAERYDKKVAGTKLVIKYPPGQTPVNGVMTSNAEVAKTLIKALEGSGAITVPITAAQNTSELTRDMKEMLTWSIEYLSDDSAGQQHSFIPREDYLDKLMVRGLLWPERAILEGTHGTKAEASEHADLGLSNADLQHRHVTRLVNNQIVAYMMLLNWGSDSVGKVRLVAEPMMDDTRRFYRTLYMKLLENESVMLHEFPYIDASAMRETMGIPSNETPNEEFLEVPQPGQPEAERTAAEDELEEEPEEEIED